VITVLFLAVLGLVFLGPQKMAQVAKKVGGYIAQYQQMQDEVKGHFERELQDLTTSPRAITAAEVTKGESA
jgi:Sec-independent protein translocase protein TatA